MKGTPFSVRLANEVPRTDDRDTKPFAPGFADGYPCKLQSRHSVAELSAPPYRRRTRTRNPSGR